MFYTNAQDKVKKIEFHSFSGSPLKFFGTKRVGGVTISADAAVNYGKHILKVYGSAGSELKILSNPTTDRYKELSILYGQEFEIIKWFSLDFFAGTGYVKFVFDDRYKGVLSKEYTSKAIGFPIEGKIRFSPTAEFSLGLHYRKNFNSAIEIIESGIFLQMNF